MSPGPAEQQNYTPGDHFFPSHHPPSTFHLFSGLWDESWVLAALAFIHAFTGGIVVLNLTVGVAVDITTRIREENDLLFKKELFTKVVTRLFSRKLSAGTRSRGRISVVLGAGFTHILGGGNASPRGSRSSVRVVEEEDPGAASSVVEGAARLEGEEVLLVGGFKDNGLAGTKQNHAGGGTIEAGKNAVAVGATLAAPTDDDDDDLDAVMLQEGGHRYMFKTLYTVVLE